ncbi:dialkylrecorsinol condensing enzyme DarA [Sphingobacterium griseoflavum]|uniref:Dialkylrecorsinol condensing protein DarA n=1 Tax=Sphingobacterium griseoflavum TaxID=1474952 RepID=A0ABQ3HW55_9SPHI|nr:dialkylrecorsinol condensing enzyme DarA [Sphingobacterium griseoflavum]GHE40570.1 dialkylrecorsinol condensing protein DarA [Sphingobacterium griseoflavum]
MKRILVIYFSQSGQLEQIARSVAAPFFQDPDVTVDFYEIKMVHSFPFPWTSESFFNTFPETFQQIPSEILPPDPHILMGNYDLILLHYQVWYLTPSIPITSFLKSKFATEILADKPVVSISGSRNMWALAQDKLKAMLTEIGGKLVGNIALTDRHHNLVSVITIVDWMFSGVKRRAYGVFPKPGVSENEIQTADKYGKIILPYLKNGIFEGLQKELVAHGAVDYRFFLVSMDQKGNRMFKIWASLILRNPSKRKRLVNMFKYYVVFAIYAVSPIVYLIELLLYPLLYFMKYRRERQHYEGI